MREVAGKKGETAGRYKRWERMFWMSGNGKLQRKADLVCHRRTMLWELGDWIWSTAKL